MAKSVPGRPEIDFVASDFTRAVNFFRNYGWRRLFNNLSASNAAAVSQAFAYIANQRDDVAAIAKQTRLTRKQQSAGGKVGAARAKSARKSRAKSNTTNSAPVTPTPVPASPVPAAV